MSGAYRLHAVTKLDKDNISQGTIAGQFAVATHQSPTPGPTVQLSSTFLHIEIFNDESLANTRASELADKAKEGGIQWDYDRLLVEATDPPLKTLSIKHPSLHHIHGDWRAAFIAGPADPLLGRSIIGVRLPCGRPGSLELRLVTAMIKPAASANANVYDLSWTQDGQDYTGEFNAPMVTAMLDESDRRLAAASTISFISAADNIDAMLLKALKALPLSSKLPDRQLDLGELHAILASVSPMTIGAINAPSTFQPTRDKNLIDEMKLELTRMDLKWPRIAGGCARTFSNNVARLGKELLDFINNPPSVIAANQPLADRFRRAAVDSGTWDDFLLKTLPTTFPADRRATAATGGEFVQKGGLERYIKRGKEAAIKYLDANLGSNLDDDQLLDCFYGLADCIEEAKNASPSSGGGAAAGAGGAIAGGAGTSTAMPTFHFHVPTNNKSSEEESRMVDQLRADAHAIQSDPAAQRKLQALVMLKDSDADMFLDALKKNSDDRLTRLLNHTTDKTFSTILQGGFESLGLQLSSMRNIIERNLERFIFGDNSSLPPERVTRAFRNARLGRLDTLKLLHLIDKDDSGSKENPLAAFAKMSSRLEASSKLAEVLDRLQQILVVTYPDSIQVIMKFMPKFKEALKNHISDMVSWPAITKWYKAIVTKISKPAVRHAMAEDTWSGPTFSLEWLTQQSDYNEKLFEARLEAVAERKFQSMKQDKSPKEHKEHKQRKEPKDRTESDLRDKLNKRKLEEEGDDESPNKAKKLYVPADEKMPKKGSDGKYDKIPGIQHPDIIKWNAEHPKKDGKFICWAHHNFRGGCKRPNCKAYPCSG